MGYFSCNNHVWTTNDVLQSNAKVIIQLITSRKTIPFVIWKIVKFQAIHFIFIIMIIPWNRNLLRFKVYIYLNFVWGVGGVCVCVGGVGVVMCVCVCVVFWLQSGICFGFYPVNWGHTSKRGYPQFLVRAVYSITGVIEYVKAPHLAIGGNVASYPVKNLNSMIIYRSTGVIKGQPGFPIFMVCKHV